MALGETTRIVRQLAADHGVCERTAWRWYAANQPNEPLAVLDLYEEERRCASCAEPLPAQATIRRRFCDGYCRVNHFRDEQARRQFAGARQQQ